MSNLLKDTFTDSAGTNLTAHVMDQGPGWVAVTNGGTWQINSANQARVSTSGTLTGNADTSLITADAGVADVAAQVDFTGSGGTIKPGIILNYKDASNWWMLNASSSTGVNIFELAGGSLVQRANKAYTISSGTTYTLGGSTSGDTITLSMNGVQQLTYTQPVRDDKTSTVCGLATTTHDTTTVFDNFIVSGNGRIIASLVIAAAIHPAYFE
jgi:hypothetical protein